MKHRNRTLVCLDAKAGTTRRYARGKPGTVNCLEDGGKLAPNIAAAAQELTAGKQLGLEFSDNWLLFPAGADQPTSPKNPSALCQGMKHKLLRSPYAHISPHDLRHAHGSLLLNAGESLVTVAKRLGHSPMVCATVLCA
jgi:hypothetical protein